MSKKLVIFIDEVHASLKAGLEELNFNCIPVHTLSGNEIAKKHPNTYGIIVRSRFPIDQSFLQHFPNLKFIARFGAGMENIEVEYAEKNGIYCLRAPEGNSTAVAEHALGMLLSLLHRIHIAAKQVKAGKWLREENRGLELEGKTVGIIGYGFMGKSFADRIKAFGCRVLVNDKYKKISEPGVNQVELDFIKKEADIISIHLPQSEETLGFVDSTFISEMSKPFYLINTARGKHVKSEDLLTGLNSGKILGACLDVLDREKSSFEVSEQDETLKQLLADERVIITPHIAGWSQESNLKMAESLLRQIQSLPS